MAEVCATDEYDYLPETPGEMRSVGSMSPEWISNTFGLDYEEQARRVAYITGNTFSGNESDSWPQLPLDESRLGFLDEAWRTHWEADEDVEVSTVPPEVLTDKAIDVWRRRDELGVDHLVVHYMQPHTPFRSRPEWFEARGGDQAETATDKDLWKRCRDGELPKDKVWDAYRDNLCWVLDSIDLLLDNCDGTVAITSDHGNGFGEWGVWGHPPGNPLEELRRVPWVTVEGRDHYSYEPTVRGRDRDETGSDTEADIEAQLDALGYR
ncbi:hypothetical protein DJ82_10980 [Halorubrum sp. Ib24]|nr:hypothetical protein DJ82_10980 [Halorubrum sp. Ib24]